MIVVADTNILFSACLSPNNKISEILFNPLLNIERISCYYAIAELFRHQEKLVKSSKQSVDKLSRVFYAIMKQVEFFQESIIEERHFQEAVRLTAGVDEEDVAFVALALQKDAWLWTGDKKLITHLNKMGFSHTFTTAELFEKLV